MIRLALAGLIATATPALAADTYTFDKNHTEIRFTWGHFGFSTTSANITDYDGTLTWDGNDPTKSNITVDMKTASINSRVPKFDEHLKSADFFDVAKFPAISFKSTRLEKTGEKTGKMTGDLTVRGVTKPVTLDVTLNMTGPHPFDKVPTLGFDARGTLKRSEFDVGKYAPMVSDDVAIHISSELKKK